MKVFGSDSNSNRITDRDSRVRDVKKKDSGESQRGNRVSADAKTGSSERVVLTAPKEMAKIRAVIAGTPEVRTKRVEQLKEQIKQGEYRIPGREIAGKMLIDMLGS